HLAMLHLPRVEDRIIALFSDLAERFGRMTGDEILIDLPLTHGLIGGLVGARRPTITLALHKLAAEGVLHRLDDGRWRLAGQTVSSRRE
ncbi:MAG: helix-turn-helix domain-containing protein, partial [Solirubrobacteraceae bacterium]